jgi:superfamily II DNA/RNA helicase
MTVAFAVTHVTLRAGVRYVCSSCHARRPRAGAGQSTATTLVACVGSWQLGEIGSNKIDMDLIAPSPLLFPDPVPIPIPIASASSSLSHASGDDCDVKTFAAAFPGRIPPWLLARLGDLGFTSPTTVQARALKIALPPDESDSISVSSLGDDVIIHAQTGSGKTLAYLIPALTAIDPSRASVQALVLVPTQELGMQVYKVLRRLAVAWPHPVVGSADEFVGTANLYDDDCGDDDDTADYEDDEMEQFDPSEDIEDDDSDDEEVDDEDDARGALAKSPTTIGRQTGFPVLSMLNQANLRRQKLQLRHTAPRIIVGNPHRIAELVESGRLRLDLLRVLIVDEFDACLLDSSTTRALQTVLSVRGRQRRQTMLVSATVPQHRHFLRQCVRQRWTAENIEHVWIDEDSGVVVPESLSHEYAVCDGRKKLSALRALLQESGRKTGFHLLPERAIVFVMPSRPIQDIVAALNKALEVAGYDSSESGEPVVGLWNELCIGDRRRAMRRFRGGMARVLIATDVAARGLDIPDVSHIFHLDQATDADSYLHRAGRAGRHGRAGTSISLVTRGEEFVIRRTGNSLGIDFVRVGSNR